MKEELTGRIFVAALETRPSSLSFYRNILKKIGTQLPTVRIMVTRILVGQLRISHRVFDVLELVLSEEKRTGR